jgi:hypothetical protein
MPVSILPKKPAKPAASCIKKTAKRPAKPGK